MMIQNQHQYQVTHNKLQDLEQRLIELLKTKAKLHPRQFIARKHGIEKTILTLRQEISEYKSLKK